MTPSTLLLLIVAACIGAIVGLRRLMFGPQVESKIQAEIGVSVEADGVYRHRDGGVTDRDADGDGDSDGDGGGDGGGGGD